MPGTSIFETKTATEDPEPGTSLSPKKETGKTERTSWFLLVPEHRVAIDPEAMASVSSYAQGYSEGGQLS